MFKVLKVSKSKLNGSDQKSAKKEPIKQYLTFFILTIYSASADLSTRMNQTAQNF